MRLFPVLLEGLPAFLAFLLARFLERFFAKITDAYLVKTRNRGGYVGGARSYLFPARDLLAFALPVMRAVAADARAADELRELAAT